MSESAISKAIAKAGSTGTKAQQKDTLERQIDAAEFYGVIKPDGDPQPRKRGRPAKSKSPGPPPTETRQPPEEPKKRSSPGAQKAPTDESVNQVMEEMKRSCLIAKVRACASWWPELCSETLANINIYLCTTQQLETICKGFEDTVMLQTEIVDIPRAFKNTIAKIEPAAIAIGMANPDHPWLSQGRKLAGLGNALFRDPAVDRNVKLVALRFLGKMPRNPFLSLLWSIIMVGIEVIKENTMNEFTGQIPPTEEFEGL